MEQPLPTADDLLEAIVGNNANGPILTAAHAMDEVQRRRYLSWGIVMDTSKIWPIDKIQSSTDRLRIATDELAQLVRTVDKHVAETAFLRPAATAPTAEQTVGEYAAHFAYLMVEVWAENLLGRGSSKRAAVHRACDAYNAFRHALLAGEARLPDRPL